MARTQAAAERKNGTGSARAARTKYHGACRKKGKIREWQSCCRMSYTLFQPDETFTGAYQEEMHVTKMRSMASSSTREVLFSVLGFIIWI